MKIRANFEYPPIPDRRFDWSAIDTDTYCGEGCPIGWGSTEAEAIADLMEQIEDGLDAELIPDSNVVPMIAIGAKLMPVEDVIDVLSKRLAEVEG